MPKDVAAPPPVAGLPEGTVRPLWSVMIPTFNCADTLERTIASVLSQDPGPARMQIEVVDDGSTRDDPEEVVRRIGGGRVDFFRQPRNLGHVGNFNTCLARARGRIVHVLHGDDWVRDGFYARLGAGFEARPEIGAAFCRASYMTEEGEIGATDEESAAAGVIDDWFDRILSRQRICTPSIVVRREVYEAVGGFDPRFTTAGEDWEMWVRIAARFAVWHEPETLACYTVSRPGSLTGAAHRTTRVARDMRLACEIIERRLAPLDARQRQGLRSARLFYAGWSIRYAEEVIDEVGVRAVLPHLREAFLLFPSRWMARRIARLVLRRPLD